MHTQFVGIGLMATGPEGAVIEGTGPSFSLPFSVPALLVEQLKSDEPLIVATANGQHAMSLDFGGNMISAGKLATNGTPLLTSRTSSGRNLVAYGSRTSLPSIEDFGEDRMVNGQAYIKIGSCFRGHHG